jgi:hypothetical protein
MRAVAFGVGMAATLGMVSVAVAAMDDPDAAVATARYTVGSEATPEQAQAAPQTYTPESLQPPPGRFDMAAEDARSNLDASNGQLTGLATRVRLNRGDAMDVTRFSGPMTSVFLDQNLRRGFSEMRAIGEKARFFLFAGDRNNVWTYNFTHDQSGMKASGWTNERADEAGEQRVGVAWQKGRTRVSLTGIERKFCQFGGGVKDRVVALTLSFSPGWSSKHDRQPS